MYWDWKMTCVCVPLKGQMWCYICINTWTTPTFSCMLLSVLYCKHFAFFKSPEIWPILSFKFNSHPNHEWSHFLKYVSTSICWFNTPSTVNWHSSNECWSYTSVKNCILIYKSLFSMYIYNKQQTSCTKCLQYLRV